MSGTIDDQAIFEGARQISSPEVRLAFLQEKCGGDAESINRIQALLQAYEEHASFLETPPTGLEGTMPMSAPSALLGTKIGPYKLMQQIGEGGMGTVFMAEQSEPVQRKVALKIIKPGMDSRQVIARFEAERQALAMMDHVNIARVIDGGTTESGRPYFVMELINGVPITKYCDDNHLTPRERLELFVPVCQAIQHAHQKGIIHRDIKPSNVLVTLYDGKPVPKVIDFGVAKAIDQKLTDSTLFTNFGTMVGTLEYMSPEQADSNALGVDTRTDIYSLGVLLYELLTGSTPLTRKRLKEAANLEILRLIKEEEPQKPSTRLSESGDALASISAMRNMEPAKLSKLVRGELDWIVMKTLEKDRNRRYETANGLAVDLLRYLNDEAVLACPPSRGYRLRKFVTRNKGAVLAACLIMLVLIAGVISTTWQAIIANQQKLAAIQRATETEAVLLFVEDKILAAARPEGEEGGLGNNVSLRKALEMALPYVENNFKHLPLVEARLRQTLATSFWTLGDPKVAAEQAEKSLKLFKQHLAADDKYILVNMHNLANCYNDLGQFALSHALLEELLAIQKVKLGLDHEDTLWTMNSLAFSLSKIQRRQEAIELFQATLPRLTAKHGPDHIDTLGCMVNYGTVYLDAGMQTEAVVLFEKALVKLKEKHPKHLYTYTCMTNLANSYFNLSRFSEAIKLRRETVAHSKSALGPEHIHTLSSMHNLAFSYYQLNQNKEALKIIKEALEIAKVKLGIYHSNTLGCMKLLGNIYHALDQHAEGIKVLEMTVALLKERYGNDHHDTLQCMDNLALSYQLGNRVGDAIKLHEETVRLMKDKLGLEHIDTLGCMTNLATDYQIASRFGDAVKQFESVLPVLRDKHPQHPFILICMNNLALNYASMGRYGDAIKLHEETFQLRKAALGLSHADTLGTMHSLADCYAALGKNIEALKLYEETLPLRKTTLGPGHPDTLTTMDRLADMYHLVDRSRDALKLLEETLAIRKDRTGIDHPDTLATMDNLGNAYRLDGQHTKALQLHEETLKLLKVKRGPDHIATLGCMINLAADYGVAGKHADVVSLLDSALKVMKVKFPEHDFTYNCMTNLAISYADLGQHADAVKLLEQMLPIRKAKYGPDHPLTLDCMTMLARSYAALGRHSEALKIDEATLAIRKIKPGPYHPDTLENMNNVASDYQRLGQEVEAAKRFEQVMKLQKIHLGPDHSATLTSMFNLALSYTALLRYGEASKLYEEALRRMTVKLPYHAQATTCMNNLSWLLANCPDLKMRNPARAVEHARRLVELTPNDGDNLNTLGVALYRAGDWKTANSTLQKSIQLRHNGDSNDWFFLAMAHWQLGQKPEARKWYDLAVQWMDTNKPQDEELRRFRAEAAELMNIKEEITQRK